MPLLPIALALAQFAPQLMRYFGAGQESAAVVDKVIAIATDVAGGASSPAEVLEKLRASTELQARFQERVMDAHMELERLDAGDRKDARARDIEIRKLTGGKNERADVMVACDAIGLVVCVVVLALYRNDIPDGVVTLLTTIASIFGLCLRDAHQFEFGTSRGSREKDAVILGGYQPMPGPSPAAPPPRKP